MVQLRSPHEMSASDPTDTGWSYWRSGLDGVVEVGTLRGNDVGLPTHFHGEHQITFVLSGRRRFLIRGEVITLLPGQGALIPAGVAHRSLAEPYGVFCLNVYVPAGEYDVAGMMRDAERLWEKAGHLRCTDLATIVHEHRRGAGSCTPADSAVPADAICPEPVSRAAARAGMSREGFSRMFARHHGMPPHAFWLMARLNHARALLRADECIAGVAVETGFSDQSHLGRWFRRAFGVTPGRYRSGWKRSQTCQTRS
jgi:AraC-like DNA-binding protein